MISADLRKRLEALSTPNATYIPIFSASKAVQREPENLATFHQLDIQSNDAHGTFDKDTGTFVAKTSGVYRVDFNGVATANGRSEIHLRVNGIDKETALCLHEGESHNLHGCLVISTLLELKSGDSFGIFIQTGTLHEEDGRSYNRFSAVHFLN